MNLQSSAALVTTDETVNVLSLKLTFCDLVAMRLKAKLAITRVIIQQIV